MLFRSNDTAYEICLGDWSSDVCSSDLDLCENITGRSFCALADGATAPITSSIKHFKDEYLAHFTNGGCPFDPMASTLFATAGASA